MPVKTLFSGQSVNFFQLRQVFGLVQDWTGTQEKQNWKSYGSFISFPEENTAIQFNFFIINDCGLTEEQTNTILDLLRNAGLQKLTTLIDPRPAN